MQIFICVESYPEIGDVNLMCVFWIFKQLRRERFARASKRGFLLCISGYEGNFYEFFWWKEMYKKNKNTELH